MRFIDQTGHSIEFAGIPKKIVSVVPSQTELLFDLGLDEEVVGITKFCIHPEIWFRTKTRVGGTKKLDPDKIESLQPDLIIANKEENDRVQIEKLRKKFNVWVSDIKTLDDALSMIISIGDITGKFDRARSIVHEISAGFTHWQGMKSDRVMSSAYLIWNHPLMVAGQNTFIHEMMSKFGLKNVFSSTERYPEVTLDELRRKKPDVLLLSSEPYPFKEIDAAEFRELLPGVKVITVDGELFSWYGSRLIKTPYYFEELDRQIKIAL
ncbi:MAG: ABC transporter substrate-binding protein [Bacteroidetes bacterium]|nr:ABC transporter substrate-binding protein [Bacteroidota bacterium]